jgi:hypothetical protein
VRELELEPGHLAEVNARLAASGLPPVRIVDPRPTSLSPGNRRALIEALWPLIIAEIEIIPNRGANLPAAERDGLVLLKGSLVSEAEARAMRSALESTRGLRIVTELETANPLLEPGVGQVYLDSEVGGSGRRKRFKETVMKDEAGRTVATDGAGRIAPGRYELADGTFVRVHAGHRTAVNPEGQVIVVAGRRYRLGWGVSRVVGPDDEGAPRVSGKVSGRAPKASGSACPPCEIEQSVARLVIGADFAPTSAEGHTKLVKLGRPAHFLIDFDGTIFQTLDLAEVARGMPTDEIHIALNNPLIPNGPAIPERHPRRDEMLAFDRSGPELAFVDGEFSTLYGYTHEQVWALGVLARRLVELFPRLGSGFVWERRTLEIFSPVERVESPGDGIYLASQLDPKRRDPGPGLELKSVMRLLAEHDDPIAPDFEGVAMAREILGRTFEVVRREVFWADGWAHLARLRRDPGHLVFRDDFHIPWFLRDELFDDATARLVFTLLVEPGEVVFDVRSATAEMLAKGPVDGFPEGLSAVAEQLQPESEWFVWKVGDPARPKLARAGHGLVRAEGEWYLVPEPWSGR